MNAQACDVTTGKQTASFPKSSRLLSKNDFFFRKYRRFYSEHFKIIYAEQTSDKPGRLGISLSKKVLKRANWRNRIRRLLKESFRLNKRNFHNLDVHIIAEPKLFEDWEKLQKQDIDTELGLFLEKIRGQNGNKKNDSVF